MTTTISKKGVDAYARILNAATIIIVYIPSVKFLPTFERMAAAYLEEPDYEDCSGDLDQRVAHKLICGIIAPRPIAFVSTIGEDGVFNLAPFSTFASISVVPAIISFSIVPRRNGVKKDTLKNLEHTRDFVINVVIEELGEAMNQTSADYPSYVDEFKEVGLTPVKSDIVKAPRLGESPVSMECNLLQTLEFGQSPNGATLVIGEIVLVHLREGLWVDCEIQNSGLGLIGRLCGDLYCRTQDVFEMKRPPSGYD